MRPCRQPLATADPTHTGLVCRGALSTEAKIILYKLFLFLGISVWLILLALECAAVLVSINGLGEASLFHDKLT